MPNKLVRGFRPPGSEKRRARTRRPHDRDDLGESGMYLCLWPNGEMSAVKAGSRRQAIIALDEWGAADPSWLVPLRHWMVNFRWSKTGGIETIEVGEQTAKALSNAIPTIKPEN